MTRSARDIVKGIAEGTLVRSGIASVGRRRLRGRALVLAYHNVVPTGQRQVGEASLHLAQTDFARQLDLIALTNDVVPLESVIADSGDSARPRVAITFDDAYHGAITAGLEELNRRAMPATVFVAPGLLGGSTWWDRLADASGGVMPDGVRRHAIEKLQGDRDEVLGWFSSHGATSTDSTSLPRIATENELASASHQSGITFGSHSWSHRNLSVLSPDELDCELAPSLAWLRARFSNTVPWLSYPYGLTSPSVETESGRARYRGAFRVSGGWMDRDPKNPHALPRLGIPAGISLDGFALRLAGIASNR
jgi:peptidoglycan/xylan/chitin deacetylase (PgdA/CDA1 family)